MTEPLLSPAQQALAEALEKLRSAPAVTPGLRDEAYAAIDQAVEERHQLEDSISEVSKTVNRSFFPQ